MASGAVVESAAEGAGYDMLELPPLRQFQFSSDTTSLLKDVQDLAEKVDSLRNQNLRLLQTAHQKLLAERVFCGVAVSGNTLTLKETCDILSDGHVPSYRKKEATHARNLGRAIELVERDFLTCTSPYTEEHFLLLHETLMEDLGPGGGEYRTQQPQSGERAHPVKPELVPMLVRILLSAVAEDFSNPPVYLAAWAHWAIARIQPFDHGSGRQARLWQDLILQRAGFGAAMIRPRDRDHNGYFESLAAADTGDLNPLAQLIAHRSAATLQHYLSAAKPGTDLDEWADRIAGAQTVETIERRRADYLRWARKMEGLLADFERCLAQIAQRGITAQMTSEPVIDQDTWDNIRSGLGGNNALFFTIDFRQRDRRHRYSFRFDRHEWTECDTPAERGEARTGVMIYEQIGAAQPVLLAKIKSCPISLREVFTMDNTLIGVRVKPSAGDELIYSHERNAEGIKLAMEFIEQVLLRRMVD